MKRCFSSPRTETVIFLKLFYYNALNDIDGLADKMTQVMADPKVFYSEFDPNLLPQNVVKAYLDFIRIGIN